MSRAAQHPLRVYAWLELGIGAIGLAVLFGMPLVGRHLHGLGRHRRGGIMLRGVAAGICLLPPTMLMGATLPARRAGCETTPDGVSWLGFFYGGNTPAAVIGSLLAGFYLLRVHDMAFATFVAVALNVLVAVIALGVARVTPHEPTPTRRRRRPRKPRAGAWAVYVAIALSGMTALVGGGHLDAHAVAPLRRDGLHVLADPGGVPGRAWHRQQRRLGARAQSSSGRAWRSPGARCCCAAAIAWAAYMCTQSLP